jgi:cell fate regulator YaaT (PSP1 superfamily)
MDEKIYITPEQKEKLASRGCCQGKIKATSGPDLFVRGCAKLEVFDWLKDLPLPGDQKKFDCVEVRFKNNRKDFFRLPAGVEARRGEIVAVEASPGHDIGIVTLTGELVRLQMVRHNINPSKEDLRKLYRKARNADIEKWITAVTKEDAAIYKCRTIAASLGLKMKVNDVEYQGDDTKAIFFYTADERVDFRDLIKKLAEEFKVRIEMRQIGVRQEASRLGGIGSCGRDLCCTSWLTSFHSVTTAAARVQQLSLNPQKLAGQCGKLKCCLNYEYESYQDAIRDFPDSNTILKTRKGDAIHQKSDVFGKIMWYSYKTNENEIFPIPVDQVKHIMELNKKGQSPEQIEDFARKPEKKQDIDMVSHTDDLNRFDKKK